MITRAGANHVAHAGRGREGMMDREDLLELFERLGGELVEKPWPNGRATGFAGTPRKSGRRDIVPAYYGVVTNRDAVWLAGRRVPIWELLDRQPDGWLTSLFYARTGKALPPGPMIWDCGAWSYKDKDVPQIGKYLVTPAHAAARYAALGRPGDAVVPPAHMLTAGTKRVLTEGDLDFRRRSNLASAARFLAYCPARLEPVAGCHGTAPEEYAEAACL